MDLPSLNVDILLYLLKFVKPVDRFNLVLSGILKGFENANEGIDLHERIECFGIELGLRRGGMCELEIRSLEFRCLRDESLYKILEPLAEKGYLQNTQQFEGYEYDLFLTSSFVKIICSMKNLEKLTLDAYHLKVKDLARVFHSCTKLIELDIFVEFKMDGDLGHLLRPGFQRLRRLDLSCFINNDLWSGIQEMLTWLKQCETLTIKRYNPEIHMASLVIDGSLTLDPNFAKSLQILTLEHVPAALAKWILSVCLNIHTMRVDILKESNGFSNETARLKKLKKLDVLADKASDLKEIVRSCRQVEILWMNVRDLTLKDLAELELAENITDVTLHWGKGPSSNEILPVLKRWTQLRRLKVTVFTDQSVLPVEVLGDFIMEMKHLSYLHFVPYYGFASEREILRDKVNELILPRRPNFMFDISDYWN